MLGPWIDLAVPSADPAARQHTLATLRRLGYSSMCWCSEITGRLADARAPTRAEAGGGPSSSADSSFTRPLCELQRISVHVEDEAHVASIHACRDLLRQFDLVAVVPHTEAALDRCLAPPAVEHIDLIVLPGGSRPAFTLKATAVQRALRAGLRFELCYAAALGDGVSRRHFVSNLQAAVDLMLPAQRRSCEGLVVSSGADDARLLRSPHDVINLLTLFGCDPNAAPHAVGRNAQAALERAARRKVPAPLAPPAPRGMFVGPEGAAGGGRGGASASEARAAAPAGKKARTKK